MINYQSKNPMNQFIMMDKRIDEELLPDAVFLLIKLMKLAPQESNSNIELMKKTKFSKYKFDKAKTELVRKGYLETKQLHGNVYAFYIGKESVLQYKKLYKKSNNRHEQQQIKKSLESSENELSKFREPDSLPI